jgi:hypothetical protein
MVAGWEPDATLPDPGPMRIVSNVAVVATLVVPARSVGRRSGIDHYGWGFISATGVPKVDEDELVLVARNLKATCCSARRLVVA